MHLWNNKEALNKMQLKSRLNDSTIKVTNNKELQHIRDHASMEWHDFDFMEIAQMKN